MRVAASSRWGPGAPDPRPFAGLDGALVVTSDPERMGAAPERDAVAAFVTLLRREGAELATELGCPVEFAAPTGADSGTTDCPARYSARCLVGPASMNPALRAVREAKVIPDPGQAHVWIDRDRRIVVIDGPDLDAIGDAFQFLRTAIRSGQKLVVDTPQADTAALIETIATEVRTTWPSFPLRSLDWDAILARHREPIASSGASLPSLQRLFAELGDAHTWVRDRRMTGRWPYRLWVDRAARLTEVPAWTPAWDAGVRPGDRLLDVDANDWRRRTSATPRTMSLMTGYRIMAGEVGRDRAFRVRTANGAVVSWTEPCPSAPWREPVSWHVRPGGTGYLDIRGWLATAAWSDAIETALTELAACPRLLVDLRGNVGGSLIAAQAFRDRFLRGRTVLGGIRFSRGDGTLDDLHPIVGEPPGTGPRWTRPVRFLIDRQTYSASEDAILGLQGLPHVQVLGEPSGGGSGRPRTVRLWGGRAATISTALTYDRHGRCVEGAGIPVDLALPVRMSLTRPERCSMAAILSTADTGW